MRWMEEDMECWTHSQKKDEAQALQEKTGYDKPDNIDKQERFTLTGMCLQSNLDVGWQVVNKALSLRHNFSNSLNKKLNYFRNNYNAFPLTNPKDKCERN